MADYKRPVGRPRGATSLKKLLRAAVVMEKEGVHPVTELIAIARKTKDEHLQVQIWSLLQEYSEAKPKPVETETDDVITEGEHDTNTLETVADDAH